MGEEELGRLQACDDFFLSLKIYQEVFQIWHYLDRPQSEFLHYLWHNLCEYPQSQWDAEQEGLVLKMLNFLPLLDNKPQELLVVGMDWYVKIRVLWVLLRKLLVGVDISPWGWLFLLEYSWLLPSWLSFVVMEMEPLWLGIRIEVFT